MSSSEHAAEQTASPASPTNSAPSPARTSFQSHGRTLSMVAENNASVRTNRFSLQFPIQTSNTQSPVRTSYSPVREPARTSSDTIETSNAAPDGNYLHMIASQERRVLELREELQRAETDLNKLKVGWAKHEAHKKRDDVKRLTRLQPLQTSLSTVGTEDDDNGSSAWMHQEMERRKALMSATRSSHRTVFPGGQRHTRTLSLLSTSKDYAAGPAPPSVAAHSPPPRKDSLKNPARHSMETDMALYRPAVSRSSTRTALSNGYEQSVDPEALIRAGKQVATGLKDGLWTFWEDLRQATVGEESAAVHPPQRKSSTQTLRTTRKQSSKSSLRDSSRSSSRKGSTVRRPVSPSKKQTSSAGLPDLANPTFWTDHGIAVSQSTPVSKKTAKQTKSAETSKRLSAVSDGWDTWDDSPQQSRSSSSVTSETATLPSTVSGSPRNSMNANRDSRDLSKKDAIPWPALKKSGLGTLRRTASHLLTEWEKSLTPSPGEESYRGEDYLGASAEAAAYSAVKGKND